MVYKLFEEIAPRYCERPGGYSRILKLGSAAVGLDRDGAAGAGLRQPRVVSRLVLEYDGSGFAGWARQPGLRTVAGEVERALACRFCGCRRCRLTVAGRTDAGVHAWGQVASYDGPPVSVRSLNALLPSMWRRFVCCESLPGSMRGATRPAGRTAIGCLTRRARSVFEARAGAVVAAPARCCRRCRECASALVGVHDFTAFTPTETEHVRFSRESCSRRVAHGGSERRACSSSGSRRTRSCAR